MYQEYETIKAHKMIVFDLVYSRYKVDKLCIAEATAVNSAINALQQYRGDTQDVRILDYIVKNSPYVFVFRDFYTMRALKAGLEALQRKEEELERACKEMNSLYRADCRP